MLLKISSAKCRPFCLSLIVFSEHNGPPHSISPQYVLFYPLILYGCYLSQPNFYGWYNISAISLQWRHNERDGVSDNQPHDCLLNHLFRGRSKKLSKLCVTGLRARKWPVTGEFPAQSTSNAENVSIWWRHHVFWTFWSITNVKLFMLVSEISYEFLTLS